MLYLAIPDPKHLKYVPQPQIPGVDDTAGFPPDPACCVLAASVTTDMYTWKHVLTPRSRPRHSPSSPHGIVASVNSSITGSHPASSFVGLHFFDLGHKASHISCHVFNVAFPAKYREFLPITLRSLRVKQKPLQMFPTYTRHIQIYTLWILCHKKYPKRTHISIRTIFAADCGRVIIAGLPNIDC